MLTSVLLFWDDEHFYGKQALPLVDNHQQSWMSSTPLPASSTHKRQRRKASSPSMEVILDVCVPMCFQTHLQKEPICAVHGSIADFNGQVVSCLLSTHACWLSTKWGNSTLHSCCVPDDLFGVKIDWFCFIVFNIWSCAMSTKWGNSTLHSHCVPGVNQIHSEWLPNRLILLHHRLILLHYFRWVDRQIDITLIQQKLFSSKTQTCDSWQWWSCFLILHCDNCVPARVVLFCVVIPLLWTNLC